MNPWLTYAPSLHLARTMGLRDKLFDLLDERPLLPAQCKQLIERILGCTDLIEPEINLDQFIKQVQTAQTHLPPVFDPRTRRMVPWVDVGALQKHCRRAVASRTWSRKSSPGGCAIS